MLHGLDKDIFGPRLGEKGGVGGGWICGGGRGGWGGKEGWLPITCPLTGRADGKGQLLTARQQPTKHQNYFSDQVRACTRSLGAHQYCFPGHYPLHYNHLIIHSSLPSEQSYSMAMQVTQPGGQICSKCKWRHLVANFGTNASGAKWYICNSGIYAIAISDLEL